MRRTTIKTNITEKTPEKGKNTPRKKIITMQI